MTYSIGEFAKLVKVGIHTLRYYEKENLISPGRTEGGRRRYSEKDVAWIEFIKRLKATGMPIKEIQRYARLRAAGDSTLAERMEMLLKHRTDLEKEISGLQEHMEKLDEKIGFYRSEMDRVDGGRN